MKIYGATIIPRHNVAPSGTNTGWNPAKTAIRNEVNQWIRTQAPFDGVLDFDKVVRAPIGEPAAPRTSQLKGSRASWSEPASKSRPS